MAVRLVGERAVGFIPSAQEASSFDKEMWATIRNMACVSALACLSLQIEGGKLTEEQMETELRPALNLCGIIIDQFEKDRTLPVSSREELQRRGIYESLRNTVVGKGKLFSLEEEMKSWAEGTRTFLDQTARLGRVSEADEEKLSAAMDTFTGIQVCYTNLESEHRERERGWW